jgi:AcrR family transcriptional regulator
LEIFLAEGIGGVRIERLARELSIAKAGFYWHFLNRDDLLDEILDFWTHEYTEIVTVGLPKLVGPPKKRLYETMKMIFDHRLTKYELAMRAWAKIDPRADRALKRVYKMRFDYLKAIFSDLGFRGAELEMRTKMFFCYFTWDYEMFARGSKTEQEKLMRRQLDWFCKK